VITALGCIAGADTGAGSGPNLDTARGCGRYGNQTYSDTQNSVQIEIIIHHG
jgi:hypothetical protein|tara:strand:+ start:380 stop:535 length:156 start_codon:yes stop_codon:yes gene_type:complete